MYKVKISVNGIIKEIMINANDNVSVFTTITNMFSETNYEIIDVRRV